MAALGSAELRKVMEIDHYFRRSLTNYVDI